MQQPVFSRVILSLFNVALKLRKVAAAECRQSTAVEQRIAYGIRMLKMLRKTESLAFAHERAIDVPRMPQCDTEMVQGGDAEIMNIAPR